MISENDAFIISEATSCKIYIKYDFIEKKSAIHSIAFLSRTHSSNACHFVVIFTCDEHIIVDIIYHIEKLSCLLHLDLTIACVLEGLTSGNTKMGVIGTKLWNKRRYYNSTTDLRVSYDSPIKRSHSSSDLSKPYPRSWSKSIGGNSKYRISSTSNLSAVVD